MFSSKFFGSIVLVLFTFFSSVAYSSDISFKSYDEALKIAKEEDKNVYVLFGADYCSWCIKQKNVLSSNLVSNGLSNYVVCYVDILKEKDLASKYKIKSVPVNMIIDDNENVLKTKVGYMGQVKLLPWIR